MGIFDEVKDEASGEHSLLKGAATGNWGAVKGYAKQHPVRTTFILGTMLNHEDEEEEEAEAIRRVKVSNASLETFMCIWFGLFLLFAIPYQIVTWLFFN